jgi:hypothetical protein
MTENEFLVENFYKPLTAEQALSQMKSEEERLREINHMADVARACMDTEHFAKYKAQYEKLAAKTVESMIAFTRKYFHSQDVNMETYGAMMLKYSTQLSTFKLIIDQVEGNGKA